MSTDKGKGKALEQPQSTNPTKATDPTTATASSNASLLDRVAASAAGLARSTFAAPTDNELSKQGASSLIGGSKARQAQGSSSAGSPAWAESSRAAGSQGSSAVPGISNLRSSQQAQQHAAAAEVEFSSFLDTVEPTSFQSLDSEPISYPSQEELTPIILSTPTGIRARTHGLVGQSMDYPVSVQESLDGMEVVDLLLNTSAGTESFPAQTIEEEAAELRRNMDLNPAQLVVLQRVALEVFPPPQEAATSTGNGGVVGAEHPLSLVPEPFKNPETSVWLPDEYGRDSFYQFGEVLPQGEAGARWVEQWESVLNRYNDEVWGDLLPLVQEAKQEVEDLKKGSADGSEDHRPKALRRLGLVLQHLKA